MGTLYKIVVFLAASASLSMAQSLSVSGVVKDSITGALLDAASVSLLHCGLADSTDAAGAFTLVRQSAGVRGLDGGAALLGPVLTARGGIPVSLDQATRVTIRMCSLQGEVISSVTGEFGAGDHTFAPARAASGIALYQVAIDGKTSALRQVAVGGGTASGQVWGSGSVRSGALAKHAAGPAALFPDTIVVRRLGYIEKRVAIADSIVSGLEIRCSPKRCTNPAFVTSGQNGGWSNGGYYVHNNMWNCASYQCAETLSACSYDNWYVVANMNNNSGDGAVKSYPNVHKDYNNVLISSFSSITSSFAETSPHVGIYNVAYDIWTNGVATPGCTEFMIWTENYNQVPGGSRADTVTFGGRAYNVWRTPNGGYIAFVPAVPFTAGAVDLLAILQWSMGKGWLPANSTLGQICFGVEIVSTGGTPATFRFTDFSIAGN